MANKVHITNGSVNTINLNATGSVNATGLNVIDAAISNSLTADSITASSVLATTDATIDGSLIITGELITDGTGKDFQEILDAHIDDNTKHVSAESIQQVVPMAWSAYDTAPQLINAYSIALGGNAFANAASTAIGFDSSARNESVALGYSATGIHNAVSLGYNSKSGLQSVNIGGQANSANVSYAVTIGKSATTKGYYAVTMGASFSDTAGSHTCTTEGTGSITIGAGANTLNNGDTESSNSVTIGCKASNQGADSVVIGAQASSTGAGGIVIGAGASSIQQRTVAVGELSATNGINATSVGYMSKVAFNATAVGANSLAAGTSVCLGYDSQANQGFAACAIGTSTKAFGSNSIAIGYSAKVTDQGATVIRSTAEDGTYTQLYFSGANTPLANTYENGEAMMGYVVRDSAGNIMTDAEGNAMVGTQKLSVLFPNNRGENAFTPAMLSMDEDWTPKPMFRPSDLDMSQEELTEPEEYQPLPVYPIVEPEIEEPIN